MKNLKHLSIKELLSIDYSKFNRGELQNYMVELTERKRVLKREIDEFDSVIRDISIKISRGVIK